MTSVLGLAPVSVFAFLAELTSRFFQGAWRLRPLEGQEPQFCQVLCAIDSDRAEKVFRPEEKLHTHKTPAYHRNNCAVIERKESSVAFPGLSFHSFRLLLLFIHNFENPENAQIEHLRDVRAVCSRWNEYDTVRAAKMCDSGSHVRRVPIDKKDVGAFISKFSTNFINSHKEYRLWSITKQYFSDESFRCHSNRIIMALE
jgi:hypothetical protein